MILHFIHTLCKFSTFVILFLVQFSLAAPIQSQPLSDSVALASENRIVRHIQFTGNYSVSSRTLEQLIRTQTNRSLFGIDALTPWVFVYKITSSRFGEAPSIFDSEVAATDVERIALYYESNGFFDAKISVSTQSLKKNRVRVVFSIDEGEQTIIETVSYAGFPTSLSTAEIRSFTKDGFPAEAVINDSTLIANRGYNVQELRDEQDRILNFLKDNGYASALRDSILVLAKQQELAPKYLDIRFVIQPGDEFQFGEVSIELRGPATASSTERRFVIYDDVSASDINVKIDSTAIVDPRALVETLNFLPDQRFNQRLLQNSIAEMQSLEMLRINRFGLGDPIIGSGDSLYLPVFFDLQALPRHTLRTELFGMERYGYGSGIGLTYTNNNAFRRAESFRFQLNSSFEFVSSATLEDIVRTSENNSSDSGTQATIFQSYDASFQYTVPRLNWPFVEINPRPFFRNAVTRYSVSYTRSNQLYFNINSDIRLNTRFEVNHTPNRSSALDFLELALVDTDPSPEFEESLSLQFPNDTLQIIRIKEDFRPQINSLIRYTHRNIETDLIKKDKGKLTEYSLTIGGNLPYLIDRFFVTPNEIEGNLPSPFKVSSNALDYNQFVKLTADIRHYFDFSSNWVFAWRFFGGFAQPFSAQQSVPLNQRFFAGGSNDIRAWAPFRLGPGVIPPEKVTINGGEIKLAGFAELRTLAFENTLSGNWHTAFFIDAGNTWYGPSNQLRNDQNSNLLRDGTFYLDTFYKQIAVSSGVGIRIDWEFVVARIDFAFRVHDLQQGWFENRKMYFNFGIGHSF